MTEMPAQASLRHADIRDVGWQWRAFAREGQGRENAAEEEEVSAVN